MTDRIRTATVVFDRDYRTDDVQPLLDALGMVKGVAEVHAGQPVGPMAHMDRRLGASELSQVIHLVVDLFGGFADEEDVDKRRRLKEILGVKE